MPEKEEERKEEKRRAMDISSRGAYLGRIDKDKLGKTSRLRKKRTSPGNLPERTLL
jgi:hypothetical protein